MVRSWQETKLEEEVRDLKSRLKACLELIEDLANLDEPLYKAELSRQFKMKYVRTVSRAKKVLKE